MSDPMWKAIAILVGYASLGAIIGVASHHLRRRRVILLLGLLVVSTTLTVAWPTSWRTWSELLEFLVQGFYMTVFLDAALLLVPFALARWATTFVRRTRRTVAAGIEQNPPRNP